MTSARVRWVCFAVLAIVVGAPTPGRAEDVAPASESHIARGVELRKLGRNADALVEFERAYDLFPTPRARAQVALALQALGDWAGAELGLEDALRADDEPWISRYRDALEGALATVRAHLAWLWVDANVPSGEFVLNRVSIHSMPLERPVRIVVGKLDIEVRGAGRLPAHRSLEVPPGATLRESFSLEPLASLPEPDLLARISTVTNTEPDASGARPTSRRGWKTGGYGALAVAAAFAGGGLAAWRVREDQVAMYNDDGRCRIGSLTREQRCGSAGRTADLALGLEIAAFATSAISAAVGAWLLTKSAPRSSKAAKWCELSGVGGVTCGGTF